MENDNLNNQEILDDDIMQCRADILRNRNRTKAKDSPAPDPDPASPADQTSRDNPVKRSDVVATRVDPNAAKKNVESISETMDSSPDSGADDAAGKTVRIPQFEDLIASENQVVDGLWETPLKTEPKPEPQIKQDEEAAVETGAHEQPTQEQVQPVDAGDEDVAEVGFELDQDNIVTPQEEQALFGASETEDSEINDTQSQTEATEQGLEALRKVVAEAKNQAQPEIDELEDIEDIMNNEDIQQIPEAKAADGPSEKNNDTTEIMNITDLLEQTEDPDDISIEDIQEDSGEEKMTDLPDESPAHREPAANTTIPKFDLAEQILKEQRQVASKRRQRPAPARNLNVMPIAGTVGQIIEQARKAVAAAAEKKDSEPKTQPAPIPDETDEMKPVVFDTLEVAEFPNDRPEPVLSVAACCVINESDRLNPFQEDIIINIVSRDIARFCGELTTNC
ncbi:MAG: hypothetical protein FVQ82_11140 [Planctomycetes bacterium]|nr:hypothetical protein [Planctomycetota bacterium]